MLYSSPSFLFLFASIFSILLLHQLLKYVLVYIAIIVFHKKPCVHFNNGLSIFSFLFNWENRSFLQLQLHFSLIVSFHLFLNGNIYSEPSRTRSVIEFNWIRVGILQNQQPLTNSCNININFTNPGHISGETVKKKKNYYFKKIWMILLFKSSFVYMLQTYKNDLAFFLNIFHIRLGSKWSYCFLVGISNSCSKIDRYFPVMYPYFVF